MKIGELAEVAQCTVETIRYYEKEGLLHSPSRAANNYRVYGETHLQRLIFIRNCRALDMSQKEVQALLHLKEAGDGSDCGSVNCMLDGHIAQVEARMAELRKLKHQLLSLREKCTTVRKMKDCRILRELSTAHGDGHMSGSE